jgi:hypothetical protein
MSVMAYFSRLGREGSESGVYAVKITANNGFMSQNLLKMIQIFLS